MDNGKRIPFAYFLTLVTYGSWLPGDPRGSVSHQSGGHGPAFREGNERLFAANQIALKGPPFSFDLATRRIVLSSMREVCAFRGWRLWAAHIRTQHVHLVIEAQASDSKLLLDLKARATRLLREAGMATQEQSVWARHGSTRYLWDEETRERAIFYTLYEQGEPLDWFDGRSGESGESLHP